MKPQEKIEIENLRMAGIGASDIALRLHLSPNTVRSHIRRHPVISDTALCANCGKPLLQVARGRPKKFCSDVCRMRWWNTHQESINKKAYYTLTCQHCGKEFTSYGNKKRKYCSRDCYAQARQHLQSRDTDALPHHDGAARKVGARRKTKSV